MGRNFGKEKSLSLGDISEMKPADIDLLEAKFNL
jgi:hypothetical protein